MAATQTVPQIPQHCNFTPIMPQRGVVTLFGYGIKVHVDRGHLNSRTESAPFGAKLVCRVSDTDCAA